MLLLLLIPSANASDVLQALYLSFQEGENHKKRPIVRQKGVLSE